MVSKIMSKALGIPALEHKIKVRGTKVNKATSFVTVIEIKKTRLIRVRYKDLVFLHFRRSETAITSRTLYFLKADTTAIRQKSKERTLQSIASLIVSNEGLTTIVEVNARSIALYKTASFFKCCTKFFIAVLKKGCQHGLTALFPYFIAL